MHPVIPKNAAGVPRFFASGLFGLLLVKIDLHNY